jgi:hypothetical protein
MSHLVATRSQKHGQATYTQPTVAAHCLPAGQNSTYHLMKTELGNKASIYAVVQQNWYNLSRY